MACVTSWEITVGAYRFWINLQVFLFRFYSTVRTETFWRSCVLVRLDNWSIFGLTSPSWPSYSTNNPTNSNLNKRHTCMWQLPVWKKMTVCFYRKIGNRKNKYKKTKDGDIFRMEVMAECRRLNKHTLFSRKVCAFELVPAVWGEREKKDAFFHSPPA